MKALFFFIFTFIMFPAFSETKTADVSFFNKKIPVFYDNSIEFDFPYKPNDDGYFEAFYLRMDATLFEVFLKGLQAQKQELRLNDWLYFILLKNSINVVLGAQKEHMRNLALWFMLNKSGYETRLEFKGKEITISVFSFDLVYGVPQSRGKGGYYIDLTSFGNQVDYKKWQPFRLNFNPNKGVETIPFSFSLPAPPYLNPDSAQEIFSKDSILSGEPLLQSDSSDQAGLIRKDIIGQTRGKELPKIFESKIVEKEIKFTHKGNEYKILIPLDSGYVEFLKDYPELSVLKHTELTLSPGAYQVLIPFLKEQMNGMDTVQSVRFLMSFCRTGFSSKKDELAFAETPYFGNAGQKVIFAPEESLFYKYVDSEDISVLFFYLVKELLNPDIVLLKYGKQVSVAISFSQKFGNPILHEYKVYAMCDVSENDDSVDIGQAPKSLAGKSPSFIDK